MAKKKREELYILQMIACFVVALFVFKMNKILSDQISTVRNGILFLVQQEFVLFVFHLLIIVLSKL
jgi:hypothetical protein